MRRASVWPVNYRSIAVCARNAKPHLRRAEIEAEGQIGDQLGDRLEGHAAPTEMIAGDQIAEMIAGDQIAGMTAGIMAEIMAGGLIAEALAKRNLATIRNLARMAGGHSVAASAEKASIAGLRGVQMAVRIIGHMGVVITGQKAVQNAGQKVGHRVAQIIVLGDVQRIATAIKAVIAAMVQALNAKITGLTTSSAISVFQIVHAAKMGALGGLPLQNR